VTDFKKALENITSKGGRKLASRTRHAVKSSAESAKDAVHATRQAGEGIRDDSINVAKALLRTVKRPIRRARAKRNQLRKQREFDQVQWDIESELETLVSRGRTLVAGPWFSEVGFETLYWIPFLHWVKAAFRIDTDRLVAVSRGGVGAWYDGLAGRYVEIWDDVDPGEFSRRNAERGTTKQYERSSLDDEVLAQVARRIGTSAFDVIHPGLMYKLFTLYWSGQRPMGFVDSHTRYVLQQAASIIDPSLLPREYIAVKFYAARSLPDTPEMRERLRAIVRRAAERMPVVLLDTGLVLEDDHADYALTGDSGIVSARPWMTPQNNLGVQTQIVAGARAFIGTCGSIAWLAPRLGIDTSALYVDPKWLHAHLAVAMRAYHKLEGGRFAAADLRALDVLSDRGVTEPAR
jgi:hypothetical protein